MRVAGRMRVVSVGMKMQVRVMVAMIVILSAVVFRGVGFMWGPGMGVCF